MKNKEIDLDQEPHIVEEQINELIAYCKDTKKINDNNISDGWHTFDELYEIRKAYNVALFNLLRRLGNQDVHKSKRHFDGEECFGGGWFIVVAILPDGQISNHYKLEDWDLFKIPETYKALYEFDGHNTRDVINRLKNI